MLRVNAIGAGAVDYLLRGSGCDRHKEEQMRGSRDQGVEGVEGGREAAQDGLEGLERDALHEHARALGDEVELGERGSGAAYLQSGVEHGEPAGRWYGSGIGALGFGYEVGAMAEDADVRAIFGELRRPESTQQDPEYIGSKPRAYKTGEQRLAALRAKEPDASPERLRQLETQAARDGRRPVAYYDFTFSPVKSVSVFYAALVTAGDTERAAAVRGAHDEAVRIALDYAEAHVAYTRAGRHASDGNGRSVGEFVKGEGLVAALFAHHTNRESEPQLHTHAAVLNRLAAVLRDGREHVGALDSRGIGAIKEAIATAYERAVEQLVSERTGVRFEMRPDGKAREIAGIDPELMRDASTRRNQVVDRTDALVEGYRARWGREPSVEARRRIADIAAYETRKPKTGRVGTAAVADWGVPRRDRLEAMLDQIDAAGLSPRGDVAAGRDGGGRDSGSADGPGRDSAQRGMWGRLSDRLRGLSQDGRAQSGPGHAAPVALSDPELRARVLAAGLEEVQQKYASWTLGNLAAAIDRQLGGAGDLGITAAQRPALLESLAREAVAGQAVVQLVGHEPVTVPAELRRIGEGQDGQPMFRPHLDQRYATAAHLQAEHRVLARVRAEGAAALAPSQRDNVDSQLTGLGLSADQRAAVLGILSSGGRGDVLVGPAGTGKSRTVSALAQAWTHEVSSHRGGGRVFGVATSEIATRQLKGDGLNALNTTRFINAFTPDATGRVRDHLRAGDMVVVDEAGMSSTAELDTITALVDAAGGKIVFTGDPAQLGSVGAGGLFAHLATHLPGADTLDSPDRAAQAVETRDGTGDPPAGTGEPVTELDEAGRDGTRVWALSQVHRFAEGWEREASLKLRDGDQTAVAEYADRGRLITGTSDEMAAAASRRYLGDLLAGKDSLLIVATNEQASAMSGNVQRDLMSVGRVARGRGLAVLADGNEVRVGDRVQTRHNDWTITVEPGRDADGQSVAPKVVNRAMYTVLGRGAAGTVLARDEDTGAVAHLSSEYLTQHTVLGYALTIYGAQGVTVDTTHGVLDRDATRELAYVLATRGRENNLMYLVTDHVPDSHDPQYLHELATERFSEILEHRGSEPAAVDIAETPEQIAGLAALGARFEVVSREASREHTNQVLAAALPAEHAERLASEGPAYERLIRTVHAAELDGHDPTVLLREVIGQRELDSAETVGDTLRWRIDGRLSGRAPDRRATERQVATDGVSPDAVGPVVSDWRDRLPAGQGPVHDYLAAVAELADQAQTRAGTRAADEEAGWAVAVLGPVPDRDTDPDRRALWEQAAGRVAAKHQVIGHDEPETTIGTAPSRERELHHQIWRAAADSAAEVAPDRGGRTTGGRAWSALSDAELYEATDRWARELDAAPRWVADQLAGAHRLARETRGEAAIERAQLAGLDPDSEQARTLAEAAARHERFAETYAAQATVLEAAHQQRQTWWGEHAHLEGDAAAATDELVKRGLASPRDPQLAFDLDHDRGGTVNQSTRAGRDRGLDPQQRDPQQPQRGERDDAPRARAHLAEPEGDQPSRDGWTSAQAVGLVAEAELAVRARAAADSAQRRERSLQREERLDAVDPDGRLDPAAREAALRARDYDHAMTQLRAEHGDRLDPDGRLSNDDLAARRAIEMAEQITARGQVREARDQAVGERLDPDCTLSHEQRSAMVWQYHQQQSRAQQVADPERADTSSRHVGGHGGHGGPAERGAGARAETGEEDGRDAPDHLAEAVRRLHDTQRAGQRDRAVEQARYDATQREQARQARQQAHDQHEAQRAARDDRDRAAADRASPDRAGADRASTHSGADGRARAPSREHGRDQAGRDQAGRGLGNGLDEGYARRNRAADDHAERQRQQDRRRGYDD